MSPVSIPESTAEEAQESGSVAVAVVALREEDDENSVTSSKGECSRP
jgi:hypothetical protein